MAEVRLFCVTVKVVRTFTLLRIIQRAPALNRSSSLQVVPNVFGVVTVEPLEFLVEVHVALVDVVDVGVGIVHSPPAKLLSLLDLVKGNETLANLVVNTEQQ